MCAFLNLPDDATGTTTVESKTNFFRAVRSGQVEAVSRPLHAGRAMVVIETELRDGEGSLVAKVTQSQLVLRA
jgi:1,4-dihydroxy-2-naphthoyl-CoA hydrolase